MPQPTVLRSGLILANSTLIRTDGYSLLNARIAYGPSQRKWEVALLGTNLSDEEYFTGGFDIGVLGIGAAYLNKPRWWGASFSYRFRTDLLAAAEIRPRAKPPPAAEINLSESDYRSAPNPAASRGVIQQCIWAFEADIPIPNARTLATSSPHGPQLSESLPAGPAYTSS